MHINYDTCVLVLLCYCEAASYKVFTVDLEQLRGIDKNKVYKTVTP